MTPLDLSVANLKQRILERLNSCIVTRPDPSMSEVMTAMHPTSVEQCAAIINQEFAAFTGGAEKGDDSFNVVSAKCFCGAEMTITRKPIVPKPTAEGDCRGADEYPKIVEKKIAFTDARTGKRYEFPNSAKLAEAFLKAQAPMPDGESTYKKRRAEFEAWLDNDAGKGMMARSKYYDEPAQRLAWLAWEAAWNTRVNPPKPSKSEPLIERVAIAMCPWDNGKHHKITPALLYYLTYVGIISHGL